MSNSNFRKKAGEIFTYAEQYLEARIELTKLNATEKIARISSVFVSLLIIGLLVVLTFLFFLVTLTLLLGEHLGSYSLAFGYVTIGLFLLFILVTLLRKKILETPLVNGIIRKIYEE